MNPRKRHYEVYLVGHGHGCYAKNYCKYFMGDTWAVSKKQAVNNIRYRIHKEGQELPGELGDAEGMGYVEYVLEAEETNRHTVETVI